MKEHIAKMRAMTKGIAVKKYVTETLKFLGPSEYKKVR